MENITWVKNGDKFTKAVGNVSALPALPKAIYTLDFNPFSGWSIQKFADKFEFNYKIYGIQEEFMDYAVKSWENTEGNLGILLNGLRGTGKTVTAKMLCNRLDLPTILVKNMGQQNQDMVEYIGGFNFDCILLIDEFEKEFPQDDSTILQLMDGVYTCGYRKFCLLTTNTLTVNENLLDRPTRIRYVRRFGNIDLKAVNEYLDDNLNDKSLKDELVAYIDTLTISTIDILKMITEEVNIHGIEKFRESKGYFNISVNDYTYRVITCFTDYERLPKIKEYAALNNITLPEFFKACIAMRQDVVYPPYVKDEDNPTKVEKAKLKAYNEWQQKRNEMYALLRRNPEYDSIDVNRKITNYKVGDILVYENGGEKNDSLDWDYDSRGDEKIIHIEENFIMTYQVEKSNGSEWINAYLILNSASGTPSIYHGGAGNGELPVVL